MPGETALTRIVGAYSRAAVAVRAATPALDAAYGASPADGRVPLIEAVLTMLPRSFDYVVVDCELSYDETLLAVLDHADQILIVLNPELGALRNAKHFLQLADTLGYARNKISFIINRANSNVGLSASDLERSLGGGRFFRMDSYGRQLTTDLNMGQPSVLAHPRSDFTRIMREVAEYIRDSATNGR